MQRRFPHEFHIFNGFLCLSIGFLLVALCMPDRGEMVSGLIKILTHPDQLTTDYFAVGGLSATFLNVGLVGLICCALMWLPGYVFNGVTAMMYLLATGLGFFGINILNVWPCFFGAFLYAIRMKKPLGTATNFAVFTTGLAPFITEMFLRYPNQQVVGINGLGILMAFGMGGIFGYCIAAGCAHSPRVHKGYSIYSAALPVGMMGLVATAILYPTLQVEQPPIQAILSQGHPWVANGVLVLVFGTMTLWGFWANGKSFRGYGNLLQEDGHQVDFIHTHGEALSMINLGVFGLMIVAYFNLLGATWTGPTLGVTLCMVATCMMGSHPKNVWPILLGYYLMSLIGAHSISEQAIVVGMCFANGLSPICGKFGWFWGMVFGALHYCLVTSIPAFHGGFCLYNGGLTACLIALAGIPVLEHFQEDWKK